MRCPFCGAEDSSVLDSRPVEEGYAIRRRRQCVQCGRRFTTYERRETSTLLSVIKKDGSREPFDREKILSGLLRAIVKRPVTRERLEQLVNDVEMELLSSGESEVPAARIGELVLKRLRDVDQVAYVRFASVYREFETPDEFVKELEKLQPSESSEKSE
jgi:transcriptional repressor NrdR